MNSLKRKSSPEEVVQTKKVSKECCPHADKCYRRNPHHFREYDHPHLSKFLAAGESFVLPENYPQEKQVVVEQLEILKSLQKHSVPIKAVKNSESDKNSATIGGSHKNLPKVVVSEASTSTEGAKRISNRSNKVEKREKSTKFVAGAQANVTKSGYLMIDKLKDANPYNLFFTKVPDAPETAKEPNSITFSDLLCPSLGDLKCSLQMNFMIDIAWLMEQYKVHNAHNKPLTLVCGYDWPDMKKYIDIMLPNVIYHLVNMKDPFGTHHSKVGLYFYTNGTLRIVISTANLYFEDWNHYNQGLWLSPECPRLPDSSPDYDGSGPTDFKSGLLTYLQSYNIPCLKEWIEHVKRADFSAVRVFLTTSIPGKHYPRSNTGCHVQRVGDLLSRHCSLPAKTTPESEGPLSWGIIAQASSIGSLGKTAGEWLRKVLLRSWASHQKGPLPETSGATLSVVYPSVENVMGSYYGADGGGCLPYSKTVHEKQKWFKDYLHQWKADHLQRSRAMPHIKTYCRVSPCTSKLAWFLITSANISKSAWGGNIQKDGAVYVRSYEMGVLFLPKFFDEEYFTIKDFEGSGKKLFPFIYDIPLTAYKASDYPWCN